MFYIRLFIGLILKNPIKVFFLIFLGWLLTVQSRHSEPKTYRHDLGFSQRTIRSNDTIIIINTVTDKSSIEYDERYLPKFVVSDGRKASVFHDDEIGWYYTYQSTDEAYIFSWIGIVISILFLFFTAISGDSDFNWGYRDLWIDISKKYVKCFEENGGYHYVFRGRLIHRDNARHYSGYPVYYLEESLRMFRIVPESFPVWDPIEVRRDKKIDKLI